MYKVRWVSMRMFRGRKVGFTYTLVANIVCFQMTSLLKSLVSSILLRSLFYKGGGLIIPPVSRVFEVQLMLWMQVQRR